MLQNISGNRAGWVGPACRRCTRVPPSPAAMQRPRRHPAHRHHGSRPPSLHWADVYRCLKRLQDSGGLVSLGGVDSGGFGGASGGRSARPAVMAPRLPLCGKLCLPCRLCRLRRHVPPAASQAVLRLRCVRYVHTAANAVADAPAPLMTTLCLLGLRPPIR